MPNRKPNSNVSAYPQDIDRFTFIEHKNRTIWQRPELWWLQDAVDPLAEQFHMQPPMVARHEHAAVNGRRDDEVGISAEPIWFRKRAFDDNSEVFALIR